jgi:hypothetical protein
MKVRAHCQWCGPFLIDLHDTPTLGEPVDQQAVHEQS